MLSTLIFAVSHGCPDVNSAVPISPNKQAIEEAIVRGLDLVNQSLPGLPVGTRSGRTAQTPEGQVSFSIFQPGARSLLKVSEHETKEVPAGLSAVFWESGKPTINSNEARVLKSMLDALELSVNMESPEAKAGPRAFKVSPVSHAAPVNPKDEADQMIYSSIQSTVVGI